VKRRLPVAPFVALAVALVVGALVVVFARSDSAADREARTRLVGQPAPILAGPTIDGGTFDLAGRRGRWVVVNFMASWCTPCRQEQPELVAFSNRHAATGDAEVVAVLVNDTPDAVTEFFGTYGQAGPAVLDPEGQAYVDFGVVKVPETYLVDPDGIVRAKVIRAVSADRLDAALTTLAQARAGGEG
jgi:cytochrome c biogenesis protein CcmG, thiol:disulfide interchange protein DsbE